MKHCTTHTVITGSKIAVIVGATQDANKGPSLGLSASHSLPFRRRGTWLCLIGNSLLNSLADRT